MMNMIIKKLLYLTFFSILFLTGCEKNMPIPAPAELFVLTDGTTSAGISVGDGPEEFQKAYRDYEILVSESVSEIPQRAMAISRIPYTDNITTMIANFFINGTPTTADRLCEEEGVSMDGLMGLLSSPTYLREHEVLYRYLLFYWEDGGISRIESDELNYNETFEVPAGTP